jgi:large subunit ribosomal protein L9
MAHNEILLLKPVEGLGGEGDQVKVRAGFARNFLVPRSIAVPVTRANKKHVEALKKRRAEREASELTGARTWRASSKDVTAFAVKRAKAAAVRRDHVR